MKVLVTGANGFLASNIIRELLRRNIEVRGMIRNGSNLKSIEGLDIELFKGEIINMLDVMNAVQGCDIIIHTAANTSQYYSDPMPLHPVNVNGTIHIIEAAKKHKIKRLVYISTVNTIGLEKNRNSKEDNLSSLYRKSGYALSKFKAEELIIKETSLGNLDAIIVKPSFMIGAFDAKPSSGRIILYFLKNGLVLYPPGGKNFIDVKCVATAICNSITEGKSGKQYVLAGENLSFKNFIHLLYQVENKKTLKMEIPSSFLIFSGIVGSLLRCIGVSTELNYYNAVILTKKELLSGEEAEVLLSMPKTNVTKAIKDAIVWYKENNYLK
jgi:dihydroflavonol-4-reductase